MSTKNIRINEEILRRLIAALEEQGIMKYGRGKKVAEKTDYSESRVSEMLSGKIELTSKFITVICAKFNISEFWVLTGNTTESIDEDEMAFNQQNGGAKNFLLNGGNHHIDIHHGSNANDPSPEYVDPIAKEFVKDWLKLSDVVKMRVWTLVKEELEKIKIKVKA